MNINIPGLDVQKGLDLYDDDEDIYFIVLRSWADNAPTSISKLRNISSDESSIKDYRIAIHGIKGTSASIGAEEVRLAATHLETLAKADDIEGVKANNEAFLEMVSTLVDNIKNWMKENNV
jgi:HPt (histidine-containing phosphotransfer) domain-containing protein